MKIYDSGRAGAHEHGDDPRRPQRSGLQDQEASGSAVVKRSARARERAAGAGRPISVEVSDALGAAHPAGVKHTVLNAKPEHAARG